MPRFCKYLQNHIKLKVASRQANTTLSDREQIIDVIETFFESGKTKDLAKLKEIQLDDSSFSSFSDVPPYDL
ncbi:MAG: hypothetical protein AABW60_06705, partial [Thermoproteota archaeon]